MDLEFDCFCFHCGSEFSFLDTCTCVASDPTLRIIEIKPGPEDKVDQAMWVPKNWGLVSSNNGSAWRPEDFYCGNKAS